MGSPTSVTTENPQPRRRPGSLALRPSPTTADSDADYFDERPYRGPWPNEAPPTGVLTEVLGEMAFYYGVGWLHYRSAQRRGKTP